MPRRLILVVIAWSAACSGTDVVPPPPPPPPSSGAAPVAAAPGAPVAPVAPVAGGAAVATPPATGTVTLAAGFNPDPHVLEGTTGGGVQAGSLSRGCQGWVPAEPHHVLVAATDFSLLRILVNAGETDTTLVVQRPDGSFVCDDDGADRRQPLVAGTFAAGTYRIWVGTFDPQEPSPYRIGFSELPNTTPSSLGSPGPALALAGDATFGTVTLTPSFMPDPHVVNGQSGGTVDAQTLAPDCRGWIGERPDHLFVAAGAFRQLHVVVKAAVDTTLVIRRTDGAYLCDDDSGGDNNPMVVGDFAPGTYGIWVGSYDRTENAPYQLGFSERQGASPAAL